MRWLILSSLLFCGCGYHFHEEEKNCHLGSIAIPYIKGDIEGQLNLALVQAISSSGAFDYHQGDAQLILEVSILQDADDRIGYRYDRDATTGRLRTNIVGTENRRTFAAEVKVTDSYTNEVVIGPQVVHAYSEYDYVDSNSILDLTFTNLDGVPERVLNFSLGQLDSIEGAHDDSAIVAFRILAQKIVDGILNSSLGKKS